MEDPAKSDVIPVDQELPPIGKRVVVVCKEQGSEFRCAGHRDEKGVWRNEARNEELKDVIGWMEF